MPSSNPAAIDMIRRLVAFDTTSRDSNLALIDYVSDYLKKLGTFSLPKLFDLATSAERRARA